MLSAVCRLVWREPVLVEKNRGLSLSVLHRCYIRQRVTEALMNKCPEEELPNVPSRRLVSGPECEGQHSHGSPPRLVDPAVAVG